MLGGLLAICIAQLSGSTIVPVFTKIGLQYLSPITFVFFRFLFAAIIFLGVFLLSKKNNITVKGYGKLMILAALLWTNVTIFTIGIQFTTVLMSQILYTATPIVVGIFAHMFLHEKITKQKIIGLIIALSGVCFLLYESAAKQENLTFGSPLGNVLILIGMLGYSGWVLYARKLATTKEFTSSQTTFFTFIFLAVYNLLLIPLQNHFLTQSHPIYVSSLIDVAFVGFGSALLYFFMQIGIKKTNAFTVSLFQYTGPIFAGIISVPLLHEKLSILFVIGGLIILFGVFYATTFPILVKYFKK